MTKLLKISAAFLIAGVCHGDAAVMYAPTQIGSSARFSDYGSASQSGWRSFDNFTVQPGGTVEKVTWLGFWLDQGNPQPAAAPAPDVLSWDIAFYADNGGVPGAPLSLESFSAGSVTSNYLGDGVFNAGGSYNVSFYQYSIDLTNPFAVSPATQYWVSVLSRSESFVPAFVLRGATGGDDSSYQEQLGAAMSVIGVQQVAADRAISLEGTVVPEPATFCVSAAALVLLSTLRRRR